MSLEAQLLAQTSLRAVTGKTVDWKEIAKECIAFANATGRRLLQVSPGRPRHVTAQARRTYNQPDVVTTSNGSQYLELHIPRALAL